jgi:asparagine N-glycosylation enzyme membrane subunit Stt3
VTLLHLPYTLWHLSYVLIGAGLASEIDGRRLAGTLLAFALAVGVAAHGLDELNGRPLGTTIPSPALVAAAVVSLTGAAAIGLVGILEIGPGLIPFVAAGVVLVLGYNLELWHGRMHSDAVFALAWGSFPVLTAYYAQTGTIRLPAVLAAAFAFGLSRTQRILSLEARDLRRNVRAVDGERRYRDGSHKVINATSLLRPLEQALATLSWSVTALGLAMVLPR